MKALFGKGETMVAIGVDPGKSGALAIMYLDDDRRILRTKIVPFDEQLYRDALVCCSGDRAVCLVEKVGAMPGQGVVSMFSFGQNYGFTQGMLTALSIPYQLVPPRTWKKEFSLTGDKQMSIDVCKRLFPNVNLLPTPRCRKENDGMAEALLMAEYARRKM